MSAEPPQYDVEATDLDEDQHPTGAWLTVGDVLDADVLAALQARIEGQD